MSETSLRAVQDRLAVEDAVGELFLATDLKAWNRVRAIFAPEVDFDMSSLVGGEPMKMTPDAIAKAWSEGLAKKDAVHHQTGNFVVHIDGDSARASCYGIAFHHESKAEKPTTMFVGSYDFALSRASGAWKITSFTFHKKFIT